MGKIMERRELLSVELFQSLPTVFYFFKVSCLRHVLYPFFLFGFCIISFLLQILSDSFYWFIFSSLKKKKISLSASFPVSTQEYFPSPCACLLLGKD